MKACYLPQGSITWREYRPELDIVAGILPGSLDLRGLTSAAGLTLPQTVGGFLDLGGLTSAEGLTLPQTVGGSLYLSGLTSAEGLTLPQTVGGGIYLKGSAQSVAPESLKPWPEEMADCEAAFSSRDPAVGDWCAWLHHEIALERLREPWRERWIYIRDNKPKSELAWRFRMMLSRFQRLSDTDGSTLFNQKWKRRRTPLGRWYWEHTASARSTSDSGSTSLRSWQTPKTPSGGGQESRTTIGGGLRKLENQALLSAWHTPVVRDARNSAGDGTNPRDLPRQSALAAWATPRANDAEKRGEVADDPRNGMVTQANLAAWTTPTATDAERGGEITANMTGSTLAQQAPLADFGETPNGFHAEFPTYPEQLSGGRLSADHAICVPPAQAFIESYLEIKESDHGNNRHRRPYVGKR